MTEQELSAIHAWWTCTPQEFAERRPWPLRNARADIALLLEEIDRLREHERQLTTGMERLTGQLLAERDALALTMEFVESGGESGATAW